MAKRVWIILLPLILLASGCTFHQGGVRLINFSDLFNSHPDYVTVRKGDTLYSISRRYNVPIRDLVEANGLTPPYTLTIGRVLRMPGARYHTVAKGDTLYSISKKYDVDLRSLSRINRLNEPYTLAIGQRLVLPGSLSNTETASYKAATNHAEPLELEIVFFSQNNRQKNRPKFPEQGTTRFQIPQDKIFVAG